MVYFCSNLQAEGSEVSQNMGQLKLLSPDGKRYLTDVAREQLEHELGTTVISNKRALHFTNPPDELPLATPEE